MLRINDAADIEVVDNLGKGDFVTFVMSFALEFALANRESRIFSSSRPVKVKRIPLRKDLLPTAAACPFRLHR